VFVFFINILLNNVMENKITLMQTLKKYRNRQRMSQSELSAIIESMFLEPVSQNLISRIENGEGDTTTEKLKSICLALKVSPVDLLFDGGETPDFLKPPAAENLQKPQDHNSHDGLMLHEASLVTLVNYLRDRIKKENKSLSEEDRSDIQKALSSCMCDLDNSNGNEKTA